MPENEYKLIPLPRITSWCKQERTNATADLGMVQSIKTHGVLQPIGVVPDGKGNYQGQWGQCRFLASIAAGLEVIPAIVLHTPMTELEAMEKRYTENKLRVNLNPIDDANALAAMMKASGRTASQLAQHLGIDVSHISKSLKLLEQTPDFQKLVAAGRISPATAYELTLVPDDEERKRLLAQAVEGKLTRDAISEARKKAKRAASPSPAGPARAVVKLGDGKSITINSVGLTLETCVDLVEQLLAKLRDARKREWSLNSFLKVQDDLSKQTSKERQP
jgi:ParB/RepB/Spo0J family partition protein